jgi:opacity protein-like surface antigen
VDVRLIPWVVDQAVFFKQPYSDNMRQKAITLFVLLAATSALHSQDNVFAKWEGRTSATQAKQPSWSVPLISPYPMLIQVFRADFTRQITPTLTSTWNYGASRGLNLIPGFNSEFDFYYPPYIQHNTPKAKDGFGDVGFLYKYRILSANEKQGNYMLSAQVTATITTGSYSNGSTDASVSPTLLGGKGFGKFDIISCLGGTLPTGDTNKLGRSIAWNNTAQYHLGKYLWPELEVNTTRFLGGKNGGKTQNFLSPGITFSKFKFHPDDEKSRLGFATGAGMQIATSQFHTYNHELVLTSRLIF